MERIPMTPEGHAALESELRRLRTEVRPSIIRAIEEARAHGDLSENAEYHAAKESQNHNDRRIGELEDKLSRAEVIEVDKLSGDTVLFGAWVTLREESRGRERRFQIVDETEADTQQGRISINSPMARALIRRRLGDVIEVVAPAGARLYKILDISYSAEGGKAAPKKKAAAGAKKTASKKAATRKGAVKKVAAKKSAAKKPTRKK